MKVFWSVGHDAKRKGAYNEKHDIYEYDVLVELTQYCIEDAISLGIDSEKVYADTLGSAIKEVNERCSSNDLAIEMHINAIAAPNVKGCEVEYYKGSKRGERLAFHVQNSLLAHLNLRNCKNDGRDDLGFLEKTKCTAIIPEPFFLSNEDNVQRFLLNNREKNLRNISYSIAIGVKDFINEEEHGKD